MSLPRRPCPAKDPAIVMCECPMHNCVLEEFRAMGEPGGKALALENYRKELRIRGEQLDRARAKENNQ